MTPKLLIYLKVMDATDRNVCMVITSAAVGIDG